MADTIYQVDWAELLPESLKQDPRYLAMLHAIAEQKRKIAAEIWRATIWPNFEGLSEAMMEVLLYDMDIAGEEFRGNAESTRELLVKGRGLKKNAGTKSAVIEALKTIYTRDCQVAEWFEYGGDPYTFQLKIDVTDQIVSLTKHRRALELVERYKNVRSHLGEVAYSADLTSVPGVIRMGGGFGTITRTALPELPDKLDFEGALHWGGTVAATVYRAMPALEDRIDFKQTVRTGGMVGTEVSRKLPEIGDAPVLKSTAGAGGVLTVETWRTLPEV